LSKGAIEFLFRTFYRCKSRNNFKTWEVNDNLPENNLGLVLIPQLLLSNAKDFINASKKIKNLGYNEINLNLGCPSGTVVSVKTRIGKDKP